MPECHRIGLRWHFPGSETSSGGLCWHLPMSECHRKGLRWHFPSPGTSSGGLFRYLQMPKCRSRGLRRHFGTSGTIKICLRLHFAHTEAYKPVKPGKYILSMRRSAFDHLLNLLRLGLFAAGFQQFCLSIQHGFRGRFFPLLHPFQDFTDKVLVL